MRREAHERGNRERVEALDDVLAVFAENGETPDDIELSLDFLSGMTEL